MVRKNISVRQGDKVLVEDIKYFFYLTNQPSYSGPELVSLANGRGDQENVIEQLKNGVAAMRMPVRDLLSNWAYMVMTALAWNLKAWFGLLLPDRAKGLELVGMEFRRFLHALILLPAQIVRSGRKIIYRILSYNSWVKDLFAFWERMRRFGGDLTPLARLRFLPWSSKRCSGAVPTPDRTRKIDAKVAPVTLVRDLKQTCHDRKGRPVAVSCGQNHHRMCLAARKKLPASVACVSRLF